MIPKDKVISSWKNRAIKQGERTVGYLNRSMDVQDNEHEIRSSFISSHIDKTKKVLDYGCGTGRQTCLFNKGNYIGADITAELLEIAKKLYPEHNFLQLSEVGEVPDVEFDMFFTSTVLQHNSDETVNLIFSNLKKIKPDNLEFVLYENSRTQCGHVKGRSSSEYVNLISNFFNIKSHSGSTHVIHGQEHGVSIIKT